MKTHKVQNIAPASGLDAAKSLPEINVRGALSQRIHFPSLAYNGTLILSQCTLGPACCFLPRKCFGRRFGISELDSQFVIAGSRKTLKNYKLACSDFWDFSAFAQ